MAYENPKGADTKAQRLKRLAGGAKDAARSATDPKVRKNLHKISDGLDDLANKADEWAKRDRAAHKDKPRQEWAG